MIQEPDTPQEAFPFILVLDPDPLMGDAMVDLLEVRGFAAVSTSRLKEVTQLLRQHHGRIRLILLAIHNASAADAARYAYLKTHCPRLPVICLAPNRSDGLRRRLGLAPEAPLLHLRTPFKTEALWGMITQTLADQA